MKRYEALADDIARSIHSGLLKPGERLPSVRETCAARKISPSTVCQAYDLLEARGVLAFPEIHFTDDEQVAFTKTLGKFAPERAGGEAGFGETIRHSRRPRPRS